jgi:hypothetical protein
MNSVTGTNKFIVYIQKAHSAQVITYDVLTAMLFKLFIGKENVTNLREGSDIL